MRTKLQSLRNPYIFYLNYSLEQTGKSYNLFPLTVEPTHASINEYRIDSDNRNGIVKSISHIIDGPVQYKCIQIDSSVGYLLGTTMRIYSSIYTHERSGTKMLNIIHCHLNDKDEEVSIETVHMKVVRKSEQEKPIDDKAYEPYMEFKNDMMGKPLKYKIMVRDLVVQKILYNTGNSV